LLATELSMAMGGGKKRRGLALAILLATAASVCGLPAEAQTQSNEMQMLVERLNRLEYDLARMQRQVSQGQTQRQGGYWSQPGADEGELAGTIATRLSARLDALEEDLRLIKGQLEKIGHRLDVTGDRLGKLSEDVDYRFGALERKPAGTAVDQAASPTPSPSPSPGAVGEASAEQPGFPSGPGVLGTVPAGRSELARLPSSRLPEGTPKSQYDFAVGLLRRGDYNEAEAAFGEFIAAHPNDPLAANAHYWLAESFYVRKQYERAAQAFLTGHQKYPKSAKAPDLLLKLGMSLAQLGQKEEACLTFAQFKKEFPNASDSAKQLAEAERQRAGCR
jgi:tol-pal system protein YbgF